jgi:phage replication-related protein YjqB (UPF0714/DUF867 family)
VATYDAAITRAQSSQDDLQTHREHCSADPDALAAIGRAVGQQVRIVRNASQYGLYTVSEARAENRDDIVRMGAAGRQRLGGGSSFHAVVDAQVPHPGMTINRAREVGEFVERLKDDGRHDELIVIAPHGGDIEPFTDRQAEWVASRLFGVTSWRCLGFQPGGSAVRAWHISAVDIREESFPLLATVMPRGFAHAVAFHGSSEPGILIGGAAPAALRQDVRDAVDCALSGSRIDVRVAGPGDEFDGDDPRNLVNRLTAGGANGVQIEQSADARANHWQAVADAVADVFAARIASHSSHLPRSQKSPRFPAESGFTARREVGRERRTAGADRPA